MKRIFLRVHYLTSYTVYLFYRLLYLCSW